MSIVQPNSLFKKDQGNLVMGGIAANCGFWPPNLSFWWCYFGTTRVSLPDNISFHPTALALAGCTSVTDDTSADRWTDLQTKLHSDRWRGRRRVFGVQSPLSRRSSSLTFSTPRSRPYVSLWATVQSRRYSVQRRRRSINSNCAVLKMSGEWSARLCFCLCCDYSFGCYQCVGSWRRSKLFW